MGRGEGEGIIFSRRPPILPCTHLDEGRLVVLHHEAGAEQVEAVLHELLLLRGGGVAALVHRHALQQGVDAAALADAPLHKLVAL